MTANRNWMKENLCGSRPLHDEKLSSLKFTVVLLIAFLLLTFWGVLAQVNAESAGLPASVAVDRFLVAISFGF